MTNTLKTSYQKTPYKLGGNGPRNVGVLTEALQNIDDNLESDIYGNGAVIEDFETKIAQPILSPLQNTPPFSQSVFQNNNPRTKYMDTD